MTSNNLQPVVITDLDGTFINGNSLIWMLELGLKRMLRRGRIPTFLAVSMFVAMRKCRIISHETMKYASLRLFGDDTLLLADLRKMGETHRNLAVSDFLEKAALRGSRVLLATAASESYVPQLWDGDFIASPFGGPDLRGERKVKAVRKWMKENNAAPQAFLTDHFHDLPMAEYAAGMGAGIYLVNPGAETVRKFEQAGLEFTIIDSV